MTKSIFFAGSGASVPFGVPTTAQMTQSFEAKLSKEPSSEYKLYDELKYRLRDYPIYDLEAMITILQDIIDIQEVPKKVFSHPSVVYFSTCAHRYNGMLDMMAKFGSRHQPTACSLLQLIKAHIGAACTMTTPSFDLYDGLLRPTGDDTPSDPAGCTIYTTNYDQVLESYCMDRKLDFEVGQGDDGRLDFSIRNQRLYGNGPPMVRIFKLHGSANWYTDEEGNMRWVDVQTVDGGALMTNEQVVRGRMVYPVVEKLLYREPFYPMFHQLRTDLSTADRCYVVGYSFRDDHILDVFHDSLKMNDSLDLIIIDPDGEVIAQDKFPAFTNRINASNRSFSESTMSISESTMSILET